MVVVCGVHTEEDEEVHTEEHDDKESDELVSLHIHTTTLCRSAWAAPAQPEKISLVRDCY